MSIVGFNLPKYRKKSLSNNRLRNKNEEKVNFYGFLRAAYLLKPNPDSKTFPSAAPLAETWIQGKKYDC